MINVAINGFGRIGRVTLRVMLERKDFNIVAINDLTDAKTLAHLFKYDSVHGRFKGDVHHDGDALIINGKRIPVTAVKDPTELNWSAVNADIIIESTGKFLSREKAMLHIAAGANKVVLSAPPESSDIKAVVLGVNDHIISSDDIIISNASCTTNCAAPMIKILDDNWGIEDGYITTVHSYTGDQRLHDAPHKDLRRARAAAVSMVPTSTGDITCQLNKLPSVEEINAAFKAAANGELKGIMEYTEDPIVSIDVVGNPHSCLFDPGFTSIVGNMVKVFGWYDNEYGYSSRLVDLIKKIA